MLKPEQPIGIFDSGVGGLTVAAAIHELLPHEHILYFGDTAHTPWGNQSSTAIQYYASRISQALLDHNCKIILIACNTASAAALEAVQRTVGDKSIVINVIDPVIQYLAAHFQNKKVGLIGTKQTVTSKAYANRLQKLCNNIELSSLATPLLVPLIEEGFSDAISTREFIGHYLSNPELRNITALILGCTHYPLIKEQVAGFLDPAVEIIDATQIIAKVVAEELTTRNLLNNANQPNKTFYVSHDSEFFNRTAQRFFPGELELQTYPLWE